MLAVYENNKSIVLDYNLLLKNALNSKEDFEIQNGVFLGNHSYLEKFELMKVKIAKIIDMF